MYTTSDRWNGADGMVFGHVGRAWTILSLPPAHMDEDEAFTHVLDTLRDLVDERLVLLTASGDPALGDPSASVTTLVAYDDALQFADPGLPRLMVQSWRGTHDASAEFPPATSAS